MKVPILFGKYGWNRPTPEHDLTGVHQCASWDEVVDLLMDKKFECTVRSNKQNNHDRGISPGMPINNTLSLQSILSHGESKILLMLAESLLSSLILTHIHHLPPALWSEHGALHESS